MLFFHNRCDFIVQVVAYFSGNKALVGSGVYTNNIDSCSWTGKLTGAGDNFHFNPQLAFRWKFFNYRYFSYAHMKINFNA